MEHHQQFRDKFTSPELPRTQELEEPAANDDQSLINPSTGRSCTDLPFLALHGGIVVVFLCLLGYCIANGDIQRLSRGYDNCGNICGKVNSFDLGGNFPCKAVDMTDKPFLYINDYNRTCVKSCSPGTIAAFGESCIPKHPREVNENQDLHVFVNKIARDLRIYSRQIIYLSFIAVAFSFAILLLLRYLAEAFVWTVLIGVVVAAIAVALYTGSLISTDKNYAIPTSCLAGGSCLLVVLLFSIRNRIPLVIQLFKESGKSISAIPILLFQPIWTFIALAIVWSAWLDFTLWIESAGTPVAEGSTVVFQKNMVIYFSRWYNHIVMLWMVQFVYGCQNMVLAGAVSAWFFTRNKTKLNKPVSNSAYNLIKYHLGTISFGSLVIVAIQLLRILLLIVRFLLRRIMNALCLCELYYGYVDVFFTCVEGVAKFLTQNAYAVTAIHGYPFMSAGRRVLDLAVDSALEILAVYPVGTIVLFLAKVLIVIPTVSIGCHLLNDNSDSWNRWIMLIMVGVLAYLIAHCFLSIYEIAMETIFVCFCEDCKANDGVSRPYYMSQDLKVFVEKCKTVAESLKEDISDDF